MEGYIHMCVHVGVLSVLLQAAGAIQCSEKETPLHSMPSTVSQPTDCLMECTAMTYINKLQLQDNNNIRLKDSIEELGEYCWSTELKCTIGESFHSAYVVLPVDMSAASREQLNVRVSGPAASTLHAHNQATTIAESCGLRYDVTPHFTTQSTGTSFCITVLTHEGSLGDRFLKCPPYLVTFWRRNLSEQKSSG